MSLDDDAKRSVTPAIWCPTRLSATARDYGDKLQDGPRRYNHLSNRLKEDRHAADRMRCCPCLPHHIIQRGNRRELVFFEADDYRLYRVWSLRQRDAGAAVWAFCLMPSGDH